MDWKKSGKLSWSRNSKLGQIKPLLSNLCSGKGMVPGHMLCPAHEVPERTSLLVQWLRLAPNARASGSIPGQGIRCLSSNKD